MVDETEQAAATVVVPTYGRPEALRRCVEALQQQTIARRLELVVVRDGETSEPELPGVTLLATGSHRGPAAARNVGVRHAGSPHVLFTDDDCLPAPDWAERLVEALEAGAPVVAGRTVSDANVFARASQVIADELMTAGPSGSPTFAPTLNLGCTRELLDRVPFDERFLEAAGEDRAWCLALQREGVSIAVVPDAVVEHVPALGPAAFLRQHLRYGRAAARLRGRQGAGVRPPSFYAGLVARGFRAGPSVGTLVVAAQAAVAVGILRERLARVSSARA